MEEETKSSEEPAVPVADASGYIKTLNSMGFMVWRFSFLLFFDSTYYIHHTRHPKTPESFLDSFALEFIDYSQSCTLPVLDIGRMKRPPALSLLILTFATFCCRMRLWICFSGGVGERCKVCDSK